MADRPRFSVLVVGRPHGVTRKRLGRLVEQAGGRLAERPGARVDLVVFAHASARAALEAAPPLVLPAGVTAGARVVSESAFRRMLGLTPPPVPGERTLCAADLVRAARLPPDMLACLAAFDVVEPVDDAFAYRDLLVAREVTRLLERGYPLAAIVEAALALRRARRSLSEARLAQTPWGEIVQELSGGFAHLDGQLALPLPHETGDADAVFAAAEACEAGGDLAGAERLYRSAMAIDRADAAIPYNLGNILDAQGRRDEAVLAYYEALQRDPEFAEAWFNLGVIDERDGRLTAAVAHYRAAAFAQPNFADALFNLALLLTQREDYDEAAALWDRFLALEPRGPDADRARKGAALCRLAREGSARRNAG
ncbi:MAG TPA: tetratricopeptide repeat protein [Beijerinckiaceae bacterium]|nr:tetratricopeptide repeat protein [Beijerinckiaceae bacterium]